MKSKCQFMEKKKLALKRIPKIDLSFGNPKKHDIGRTLPVRTKNITSRLILNKHKIETKIVAMVKDIFNLQQVAIRTTWR